jgi:hypothetical protein
MGRGVQRMERVAFVIFSQECTRFLFLDNEGRIHHEEASWCGYQYVAVVLSVAT